MRDMVYWLTCGGYMRRFGDGLVRAYAPLAARGLWLDGFGAGRSWRGAGRPAADGR